MLVMKCYFHFWRKPEYPGEIADLYRRYVLGSENMELEVYALG